MEDLLACRICLNTDVKMFDMYKYQLTESYESVIGTKMQNHDCYPKYACCYCGILLLKFAAFKDKCIRAQRLLNRAFNDHHLVTTNLIRNIVKKDIKMPYVIDNKVVIINYTHIDKDVKDEDYPEIVKVELNGDTDYPEEVKEELNEDTDYQDTVDTDFKYEETSDDEPLIKKVSKKRSNNATRNDIEYDNGQPEEWMENEVEVIFLTKEQQVSDIQSRKNSVNYLNALYKCDKCFKGFITESTFKNHMESHNSSIGPHVCDVCFTYWADVRSLRSHLLGAHERRYVCRRCNFVSKSSHQAKSHSNWHKGVVYICKICGITFKKPTSHLTHMRLQHPSNHSCDVCGESFIGKFGLNLHKKKKHKNMQMDVTNQRTKALEQTRCVQCDVHFGSSAALERHLVGTHDCSQSKRPCVHCGEDFENEESLREHTRSHCRDIVVRCEPCNKTFASEKNRAVHHRRVHLGVKVKHRECNSSESICEICGKKCYTKATLINHLRTHTGEKPHECNICGKRFGTAQHLQIHFRTHTDERPFKCSNCPKAFKQKAALNRHNRVHTGAKPYSCPHCDKSFSQSNSTKVHIRTVHLRLPAPYRNRRNKDLS